VAFQTGTIVKAVYAVLSGDSTLTTLCNRINVIRIPKDETYPSILIGDRRIPSTPMNVFGRKGRETLFTIVVYNPSRSISTIDAIAKRIDVLLDETSLTIDGNEHICTQIQEDSVEYDEDNQEDKGMTYIRLTYKITTQES
jgi:hypothetical protein